MQSLQPYLSIAHQHAMPVLQKGYETAAPYITPYIPSSVPHVVMTSSLGATVGGQVITLIAGDKLGMPTSLAIAYFGSYAMETDTTKALLITAGIQLLPSIVKKVVADVTSATIIAGGGFILTAPFRIIGAAWSAASGKDQKLKSQQLKIERLREKKLALTKEKNALLDKVKALEQQVKARVLPKTEPKIPEESDEQ